MDFDAIRAARAQTLFLEPEHIGCIVSGVRRHLVFLLARHGPCSIADLAELAHTYPAALYHHMRKLLACGLFREVGTRRSGARDETVYDVIAQHYRVKPQPWEPGYAEQCLMMFQSEFKMVGSRHDAALLKYGTAPEPNAFIGGKKIDCELDAKKIEELKVRLEDLGEFANQDPETDDRKNHWIFVAVFPVEP